MTPLSSVLPWAKSLAMFCRLERRSPRLASVKGVLTSDAILPRILSETYSANRARSPSSNSIPWEYLLYKMSAKTSCIRLRIAFMPGKDTPLSPSRAESNALAFPAFMASETLSAASPNLAAPTLPVTWSIEMFPISRIRRVSSATSSSGIDIAVSTALPKRISAGSMYPCGDVTPPTLLSAIEGSRSSESESLTLRRTPPEASPGRSGSYLTVFTTVKM